MKNKLFFFVIGFLFLAACHHEIVSPGNGENNVGGNDSLVCFEGQILPIFISNCAKSGCHNSRTNAGGYVFDGYDNIIQKGIALGNANGSKLYQVIQSGEMPPRGYTDLSANQIALIKRWIDEGAKNTTGCSNCDTTIYTYSGAVSLLMDTYCAGCHDGKAGFSDLKNYTEVQAIANNGKLMGSITHAPGFKPMPEGGQPLSECEINQIRKWVVDGAPNN